MKYIVMLLLVGLAGCKPDAEERVYSVLPEELKDCRFFRLTDELSNTITVARCPNSSTTVKVHNKQSTTSVVIDGVEYTKK
jgi:hypothetical protein